ncbi:hypothetical protein B0H14DRAFT_3855822 [Mycena olivaceomarginata]|nr:hypothetical protein B0H14DRAFT_3855822 [Mycena olivaceomarginata]
MGENRPSGVPTSASPKKRASTSKVPANIPVSQKKDDSIQWDTFAARTPDKPVPVYDARSVDFDIKNFQRLPKYDEGEKLSHNVQAAVAMHNAVPEEDRPSETIIDAKFPLAVN